jgi:hypothetical protein
MQQRRFRIGLFADEFVVPVETRYKAHPLSLLHHEQFGVVRQMTMDALIVYLSWPTTAFLLRQHTFDGRSITAWALPRAWRFLKSCPA